MDRILASKLGAKAVKLLMEGQASKMVGLVGNKLEACSIKDVLKKKKEIDLELYELHRILSI